MKPANTTQIMVYSDQLSKEDIQRLLQAIRDCEQRNFSGKEIVVFAATPWLTTDESSEMLRGIVPPFQRVVSAKE